MQQFKRQEITEKLSCLFLLKKTMNSSEEKILFDAVRSKAEEILGDAPGCHDFAHTLRVLKNAERILAGEQHTDFEGLAVRLAALLHDIARPEEMKSNGGICHAEQGGLKAPALLRELGCRDEALIESVGKAVARHRYRGKNAPQNLIEKIVYDADKLDSIGAVGVGRAFHFAGRIGAKLHNTSEAALNSEAYSEEDSAYREYLVKLRSVPERMLTVTGRKLAEDRSAFMHEFFRRMNEECDSE